MLGKEGVSVPQRGLGAGAGGQGAGLLGCGLGSGRILGIGGKAYAQRKAEDKQQAGCNLILTQLRPGVKGNKRLDLTGKLL